MNKSTLTDLEEKFCTVYACGPAPYNGNAKMTYNLVFKGKTGKLIDPTVDTTQDEVNAALEARKLMIRDDIRDYIDNLQSKSMVNAATLRPRLTETLLRIADECSTLVCTDKFGTPLSPAPLRSVAVNAVSKLSDMYGIKEDITHKLMLEGADGEGITFNLIMPEPSKDNEISNIIEE